MPNNLTDAEIIKALECCSMETECRSCPLYKLHSARCVTIACENAIELITRLKDKEREYRAKVQSQRYEINCNQKNIERYKCVIKILEKDVATAKSEAIKEFAERLKEETLTTDKFGEILLVQDIDNLAKEMVGENND